MNKIEIIKLKGGAEVLVDWSSETSCKACGAKIWWAKTAKGKLMPINLCGLFDYESHFASCPNAAQFRKKK